MHFTCHDDVSANGGGLHDKNIYNLYSSNIIRVAKSRKGWSGCVEGMGGMRSAYEMFFGKF